MMALRSIFVVGILFSAFTWNNASGASSKLTIPRISSAKKPEFATHRPYKVDFDLLRASEKSHELAMPLLTNNDLDREDSDDFILLTSDPTLRSRRSVHSRQRRQVQVQNSDFQRFSLCLPYFSTNPMCRQVFLGLNNGGGSGGVVPSSTVALQASSPSSPSASPIYFPTSSASLSPHQPVQLARNDLALNYYYQQQQQPQAPPAAPLQIGVFQGPLPVQRQRQNSQYENIHVKYPYPYPPTLEQKPPSPPQAVVPESVGPASPEGISVTTVIPSDLVGETTPYPQGVEDSEVQDPSVLPIGYIPDSPSAVSPSNPPESNLESSHSTTNAPPSSPPLPVRSSSAPPASSSPPPAISPPSSSGGLPASPPAEHNAQLQAELEQAQDLAINLQKRLKELEDANRQLNSQLDQSNQQVVSYEMESSQYKEQYQRSEDANMKLRDRVLQLENTNQHLQEQNGQLQQVTTEQRTQINALKLTAKDVKQQLAEAQEQFTPLSNEVQKHRKEIEGFLIRIRKLGEENETCKKQVRLYQLKINYIQEQQGQRDEPVDQEEQQDPAIIAAAVPPAVVAVATASDPVLARMDAEIKDLQRNAGDVAVQLEDLQRATTSSSSPDVPEVTTLLPDNLDEKSENENEFPGEAVQIPQRAQPPQEKIVATAADVARAKASRTSGGPAWEMPAGF